MKLNAFGSLVLAFAPASCGPVAQRNDDHPDFKAIGEAGFIYGLPIVMNYAAMYEYAGDRSSGQFKAPFAGSDVSVGLQFGWRGEGERIK